MILAYPPYYFLAEIMQSDLSILKSCQQSKSGHTFEPPSTSMDIESQKKILKITFLSYTPFMRVMFKDASQS